MEKSTTNYIVMVNLTTISIVSHSQIAFSFFICDGRKPQIKNGKNRSGYVRLSTEGYHSEYYHDYTQYTDNADKSLVKMNKLETKHSNTEYDTTTYSCILCLNSYNLHY